MARQNRVTPFSEIIATPERGTFFGNRGVLHDAGGNITRAWQVKRWLICVLDFKDRKRTVMTPGHYTELFFLDEATGLAAGHRPCAECRRERLKAFLDAWPAGCSTVGVLDHQLHARRLNQDGTQQRYEAKLADLPDGVFIMRYGVDGQAYLLWKRQLLAWSPGGYRERISRPRSEQVLVLTPRLTVAAIRAGYVPEVHASADQA